MITSKRLAGVLIELRSGVEPSVPSGRVVSYDGAVRVASEIAVNASRSPEGRKVRPTAMLYTGTPTNEVSGAHRTVDSFNFRAGLRVGPHGVSLSGALGVRWRAFEARLTATFKKVALPKWRIVP